MAESANQQRKKLHHLHSSIDPHGKKLSSNSQGSASPTWIRSQRPDTRRSPKAGANELDTEIPTLRSARSEPLSSPVSLNRGHHPNPQCRMGDADGMGLTRREDVPYQAAAARQDAGPFLPAQQRQGPKARIHRQDAFARNSANPENPAPCAAHPMQHPVEGHAGPACDRLKYVTDRLTPLLANENMERMGLCRGKYSASKFRVFGANAMVAWTVRICMCEFLCIPFPSHRPSVRCLLKNALTLRSPYLAQAVQLCQVLSGTENKAFRAAALWGLGSLVCETTDLQNFIAGGAIIMEQIFSDAVDADESLQSCAAYTLACLSRHNRKLQDRIANDRDLIVKISSVLQESTSSNVIFANMQAVGNICCTNLRAQQLCAAEGILGTVDALTQARDGRIRTTASRCHATFVQLLARCPDVRMPAADMQQGASKTHLDLGSAGSTWSSHGPSQSFTKKPSEEPPNSPERLRPPSGNSGGSPAGRLHKSPKPARRRPQTSKGRLSTEGSPVQGRPIGQAMLIVTTKGVEQQRMEKSSPRPNTGWVSIVKEQRLTEERTGNARRLTRPQTAGYGPASATNRTFTGRTAAVTRVSLQASQCSPSLYLPADSLRTQEDLAKGIDRKKWFDADAGGVGHSREEQSLAGTPQVLRIPDHISFGRKPGISYDWKSRTKGHSQLLLNPTI